MTLGVVRHHCAGGSVVFDRNARLEAELVEIAGLGARETHTAPHFRLKAVNRLPRRLHGRHDACAPKAAMMELYLQRSP